MEGIPIKQYTTNNQEQLEAMQIDNDKKRNEFILSLPKEEQNKFKAVEKAVKILVDAKIPFYLYPYLRSSEFNEKYRIWQYNSIGALLDISNEKDKKTLEMVNEGLFIEILLFLSSIFKSQNYNEFIKTLYNALPTWMKRQEDYFKNNN